MTTRSAASDEVSRTCRAVPFWWDDFPAPPIVPARLPARADLVVVGSGYTGLSAAIEGARGGMSVVVLEAETVGWGCSTRNGGQVSTSIKPSLSELTKEHGADLAARIRAEGRAALEHIDRFIRENAIPCDWERRGRYTAAHSPKQFRIMEKLAEAGAKSGEAPIRLVPRADQHTELASPHYFGGMVTPGLGAVHPAKLHAGLVRLAQERGVTIVEGAAARSVRREAGRFEVRTERGTVSAAKVLIATNGYSGDLSPWARRRIIPIGSYMLATEELPVELARSLIPARRTVIDTRKVVIYFRMSPDGKRLLFGGRAALWESDPMRALPRLRRMMLDVFPQLERTRITHAWHGTVAYTFDTLPHLGVHDGVHYCMGYCGSGVSLSLYFGMRAGQQILGRAEGKTALDDLPFATRPFYTGTPWFLAPSILYYRIADRLFS